MANLPLATNDFYRNKEGEEISKTEWHQIVYMSGTYISKTILKLMLNLLHSSSGILIKKMSRPGLSISGNMTRRSAKINDHISLLHNAFEATVQKIIRIKIMQSPWR